MSDRKLYLHLAWALLACALAVRKLPEWLHAWESFGRAFPGAGPGPGLASALGGHAGALVILAGIWLAAFAAGRSVIGWLNLRAPRPAALGLRLLGGLGVVSLLGQGLGLTGLLQPVVLDVLAGVLVGAGVRSASRVRPWRIWRDPKPRDRLPAVLVGLALATGFLLARLPDSHEDALVYQFAAPEEFLRSHKLHAEPFHFVWHMPLGAEMLALIPFRLAGLEGGKLTNLVVLAALLPLLGALARAIAPAASGWWAGCWLLSAGLIADQLWQGKNDVLAAGYLLAAAWCVTAAMHHTQPSRWGAAAGWFIGLALGVKWTAALAGGGLLVAAAWHFRRSVRPALRPGAAGPRAVALAGWAGPVVCAVGGWWTQAWLFTGNPVHPFLSGMLPEPWWNPDVMAGFHRFNEVMLPVNESWGWTAPGSLARAVNSPALLALAPLALAARLGPPARVLRLAGGVAIGGWLLTEHNGRYLFPLVPWLAALVAAATVAPRPAWGRAGRGRALSRTPARLAIAAHALACVAAGQMALPWGDRMLSGGLDRATFLRARYTTWDDARRWINGHTPPAARVMFVGDQRRLWLERRVFSTFVVTVPPLWRMAGEAWTPTEMRKRLRQTGVTHVLYNFVTGAYRAALWYPGPEWDHRRLRVYGNFMKTCTDPVYVAPQVDDMNGGFVIVALAPVPSVRADTWTSFLPSAERVTFPGKALFDAGHPDRAAAALRQLLTIVPNVGDWNDQLGACYWRMGDQRRALATWIPFIDRGMVDGYNVSLAGFAAFATGQPRLGERLLRRAIAVYPESSERLRLRLAELLR